MDARLLEAAQSGNIVYLHQLLAENPLILLSTALFSSENPLHIASIAGHVDFVKDLLRLKPEFAQELNQDGYSPMHMAATIGHVEIVRELAKVDSRLCRVQGKQKKTPLHLAAIKGRAEVTSVMLMSCPDCIEDVTVRGETAVHQAVKNNQFHAVNVLVDWIRGTNREEMLNVKDELGNTVLHLAAWKKQRQVIELLLGAATIRSGILEVNAKNNSGLTCLDLLLIFPSEAGDAEVIEILRGAGALQAKDISHSPISSFQYVNQITASTSTQITPSTSTASETCQTPHPNNLVNYFKFKKGRDSPSEARSALLVIAVLVSTATFQVGISPPGGVWQDSYIPDGSNSTRSIIKKAHYAGESVVATSDPIAFAIIVLFNTIGLAVSLFMINILTSRFPLQFELQICMVAMYSTYNTALVNMSPDEIKLYVILTTVLLSSIAPIIAKLIRLHAKRVTRSVIETVCLVVQAIMGLLG